MSKFLSFNISEFSNPFGNPVVISFRKEKKFYTEATLSALKTSGHSQIYQKIKQK